MKLLTRWSGCPVAWFGRIGSWFGGGFGRSPLPLARLLIAPLLWVCSVPVWAETLDCKQVNIESVSPLNFGMLRIKRGHTGWMVLDVGGGIGGEIDPALAFIDAAQS